MEVAPLPAVESCIRPGLLPFQREMALHLKTEEADLWKWFSSTDQRGQRAEAVRLDLLKSTYRLERPGPPGLYDLAEKVSSKYQLAVPITFYQAQGGTGPNAALAYVPGEVHIVFSGPILAALSEAEIRAVLA